MTHGLKHSNISVIDNSELQIPNFMFKEENLRKFVWELINSSGQHKSNGDRSIVQAICFLFVCARLVSPI